jgi:hypothetical protein
MKQGDEIGCARESESPRARVAHFIRRGIQRGWFSSVWEWFYWFGALAMLAMLMVFVLSPLLGAGVLICLLGFAIAGVRRLERKWREEERRNPEPPVTRDWLGRELERPRRD